MADLARLLMLQIGAIILATFLVGVAAKRLKVPSVLGLILLGIVIGPYGLGGIPLPGFPQGFFPMEGEFPVSSALYGFSQIAAILLLFLVGLETDFDKLMKYSLTGSLVGTGGALVSFAFADVFSVWFSRFAFDASTTFSSPGPLLIGTASAATSVGITARILSERRKVDSPEGVTILSAAVLDDILGVLLLTIALSICRAGTVGWGQVGMVSGKALLALVLIGAAGFYVVKRVERFMVAKTDPTMLAIITFAIAMIVSAAIEGAGLSMIIGAYLMGLIFSRHRATVDIQTRLAPIYKMFVPVFFCVMGMLADFRPFLNPELLGFGLSLTFVAVLAKILGCSGPCLLLGYTTMGSLRVGLGMIPRGEVALIVCGVGLASGYMDHPTFAAAMMMTMLTTLLTPPLFVAALHSPAPTLRRERTGLNLEPTSLLFRVPSDSAGNLIHDELLRVLRAEGCAIRLLDVDQRIYHVHTSTGSFAIDFTGDTVRFDCSAGEISFVNTAMCEALASIEGTIAAIRRAGAVDRFRGRILEESTEAAGESVPKLPPDLPILLCHLAGLNKQDVLKELVEAVAASGRLGARHKEEALRDLLAREALISTGLQHGVAFPHCRSDSVSEQTCVVGVHPAGIPFGSLDGEPTRLFAMILTPTGDIGNYLHILAMLSRILGDANRREAVLAARTNDELVNVLNIGAADPKLS